MNDLDKFVGSKLRQRRRIIGMSQQELSKKVGLTFQQIQKYEKGHNRIGAGRLYEFSRILNVDISYFFEGLEGEEVSTQMGDMFSSKESLTILKAFYDIKNEGVRKNILRLMKELGSSENTSEVEEEDEPKIVSI